MMLNRHLYLSGIWLGVYLKNNHQKDMCWKEIVLGSQNFSTILDILVNIMKGGVRLIIYINSKYLQFDNKHDIHNKFQKLCHESGHNIIQLLLAIPLS